jgi:hypothetical protein
MRSFDHCIDVRALALKGDKILAHAEFVAVPDDGCPRQ